MEPLQVLFPIKQILPKADTFWEHDFQTARAFHKLRVPTGAPKQDHMLIGDSSSQHLDTGRHRHINYRVSHDCCPSSTPTCPEAASVPVRADATMVSRLTYPYPSPFNVAIIPPTPTVLRCTLQTTRQQW